MLHHVHIAIALVAGSAIAVLAALGMALSRTPFDRIHFTALPGASAVLFAAAIWLDTGPSLIAVKATILAVILVAGSPLLAHVMSRSIRRHQHGDWEWRPEDGEMERG